jgi:hypothetical protein
MGCTEERHGEVAAGSSSARALAGAGADAMRSRVDDLRRPLQSARAALEAGGLWSIAAP